MHCFKKCRYNCCQSNFVTCLFGSGTSESELTRGYEMKDIVFIFLIKFFLFLFSCWGNIILSKHGLRGDFGVRLVLFNDSFQPLPHNICHILVLNELLVAITNQSILVLNSSHSFQISRYEKASMSESR